MPETPNRDGEPQSRWRAGRWMVGAVVALAACLIGLAYLAYGQPSRASFEARTEEGAFEQMTLVFYGLAVVACLVLAVTRRSAGAVVPAVILTAMLLRELDFHIRFSDQNTNSIRFWKSPDISIWQKLITAAVIAVVLWALVTLVRRHGRAWLQHVRLGHPYALAIAGALAFVLMSYALDDRLDMDKLKPPNIDPVVLFLSITEEAIETGIPILLGAAVLLWARATRGGARL